jgi:hypothetical protein
MTSSLKNTWAALWAALSLFLSLPPALPLFPPPPFTQIRSITIQEAGTKSLTQANWRLRHKAQKESLKGNSAAPTQRQPAEDDDDLSSEVRVSSIEF